MITRLQDYEVENVVGGLDVSFVSNDNVVSVPNAALNGLTQAIPSVLGRGNHSIANIVIPGEPTLGFDAGEQGIY